MISSAHSKESTTTSKEIRLKLSTSLLFPFFKVSVCVFAYIEGLLFFLIGKGAGLPDRSLIAFFFFCALCG